MKPVTGISTIIANYDALILDLWGVVHDGSHLYPGVHETLGRLRKEGKKIIMLSNAPRRAETVEQKLNQLGIEKELYDGVLSSGEEGYQWLKSKACAWGKRYYYIGPPKDAGVLAGLDYQRVDDIKQADFLLNVGYGDDNHPLDEFTPLLRAARAGGLPMLCLNPDLEVVKISGERYPCAGAIAKQYEQMGGQVKWFGKPYPAVYERCMSMLGNVPKERVLMVGDGLGTDILGAQQFGIDSALVTGGLLKHESTTAINDLCLRQGVHPTYAVAGLEWKAKAAPDLRK